MASREFVEDPCDSFLYAARQPCESMQLANLIKSELVFSAVEVPGSREALWFFAQKIADSGPLNADAVYKALEERESLGSTGIGGGVAIPHCRMKGIKHALLAVGISRSGVAYEAADGKPVQLFFVIVSPQSDPQQNLKILSAISRWVREEGNVDKVLALSEPEAILEALAEVPGC